MNFLHTFFVHSVSIFSWSLNLTRYFYNIILSCTSIFIANNFKHFKRIRRKSIESHFSLTNSLVFNDEKKTRSVGVYAIGFLSVHCFLREYVTERLLLSTTKYNCWDILTGHKTTRADVSLHCDWCGLTAMCEKVL